jgi:hypothetical protein
MSLFHPENRFARLIQSVFVGVCGVSVARSQNPGTFIRKCDPPLALDFATITVAGGIQAKALLLSLGEERRGGNRALPYFGRAFVLI